MSDDYNKLGGSMLIVFVGLGILVLISIWSFGSRINSLADRIKALEANHVSHARP
jgi:hypothetical protein